MLTESAVRLSYPSYSDGMLYWLEGRPNEGGRTVLVRAMKGGITEDAFGSEFSARTLVHEYGGLCYTASGELAYFSNFADQRLYRVTRKSEPEPITPEPQVPMSVRYAAPVLTPDGRSLYCVRETHGTPDVAEEVVNEIVVVPTEPAAQAHVVATGHDFYSFPTLSPDGSRLAFTCWDHPRMPWDGTQLYEFRLGDDGLPAQERLVAGGEYESVTQPRYSPDGALHYVSDTTGWWNIYRDSPDGASRVLGQPVAEEFAGPDWVFGLYDYCFLEDGSIVAISHKDGAARLSHIGPDGSRRVLDIPFSDLATISARSAGGVVLLAASPTTPDCILALDVAKATWRILKSSRATLVETSYISKAETVDFETEGGLTAHALYYAPTNPDFEAPQGELPPLIVASHGGPTSATSDALNLQVQYFTSRGFAVVDVNYGGSSGYGREYRERLKGNWGVVDIDDCVNAARHLAATGRADAKRLLIHGGSAGGYTTLCALTFRDVFAAGASYFGVADAGALARDTHKFESRYLDGLIGPWPAAEKVYEERSPIFHTDKLKTPMILFQGLEDKVVPPAQSEQMAEALRGKGIPFAYLAYEGEQHGFRKAENIRATYQGELKFYSLVLGFEPADELPWIPIENAGSI